MPGLVVVSEEPFNAAPTPEALAAHDLTPAASFFIRNHGPVPRAPFAIDVDGLVERPFELTGPAGFARASVTATLPCAGNRRAELMAHRDIPGELPWDACAIGTAVWEGVRLRDVLERAGLREQAAHVELIGGDDTVKGGPFGGSIPRAKALADEVLLADRMNGEPLPAAHGGPVRAIVPGYIGARSVKWLRRITARAAPSENPYQAGYAVIAPDGSARVLGEFAVTSAILSPGDEARLAPGEVEVHGYACTGNGSGIDQVQVGIDGSWARAELLGEDLPWAWRRWRARLVLEPGEIVIACRARDRSGAEQPSSVEEAWNPKGYANNAWHRARLRVG